MKDIILPTNGIKPIANAITEFKKISPYEIPLLPLRHDFAIDSIPENDFIKTIFYCNAKIVNSI